MKTRQANQEKRVVLTLMALGILALAALWVGFPLGAATDGTAVAPSVASPDEGEKESGRDEPALAPEETIGLSRADASRLERDYEQERRESDLFRILKQRERELDDREKRMEREAEHLRFLRASLEETIAELKELRQKVQTEMDELVERQSTLQDEEVRNLAKIYENMQPEEAAKILEEMDERKAETILYGMKSAAVSPILGVMEKTKAATLSARLISQSSRN